MGWRLVSLLLFVIGIVCLPVWPYSRGLPPHLSIYAFFLAVLTLLVSIFAKHGSVLWKGRGHS